MNLKKVLYENYGIVIKKSEEMFWNHIVRNKSHQKLSEALEEFSSTTELQYFNHRHFNNIASYLVKEEISHSIVISYEDFVNTEYPSQSFRWE